MPTAAEPKPCVVCGNELDAADPDAVCPTCKAAQAIATPEDAAKAKVTPTAKTDGAFAEGLPPVSPKQLKGTWIYWWIWSLSAIALWIFPACMQAIYSSCMTTHFGHPPCGPWAATTMNTLFVANLVAVAIFVVFSPNHPVRFLLAVLMAGVEILVATVLWFFGTMSVSGFYF